MQWSSDPDDHPAYLRNRIRRGQGCGVGVAYVPWHRVRDVNSRGTSDAPGGIRIRRNVHLLSDLETIYFLLLERRGTTVDVREQFPILDIKRTLELCAMLGLPHKRLGKFPEPFTMDFLITEDHGDGPKYRVASIKPVNQVDDEVTQAKLHLEFAWCRERGIPWTLVDVSRFNDQDVTLATLRFLRAWFLHRFKPVRETTELFANRFMAVYQRNIPLAELIAKTAKETRTSTDVATDQFRYCAWAHYIEVSVTHVMALNRALVLRA